MAKKKSTKKETVVEEVVSFDNSNVEQVEIDKSIEELNKLIEEIKPIDMSKELEEMKKEIFEEKKEVVKEEVKEEKPKTIKEKINHTMNHMFGFIWNGMEYD